MKSDPTIDASRDTRPTICQLVHTLGVGGAEILAREFALRSADYRFVFACLDQTGPLGDQLQELGYCVAVLGRQPGIDWQCIRRLARFCREQQVGLIHAHQYGPFFYAELASRLARSVPVLFTEHGRDYPDYRRPKRVWANRALLRRRDRVVAVGQYVREALVQYEGIARQRVEVVYNGVHCEAYGARERHRAETRVAWGLNDSHLAIVQVARLNRLKDQGTALRAMAQVIAEVPHARLVLVGDGEERGALEALTAELNLSSHVVFAGFHKDVARMLSGGDVFLLSSISEGIPLTLLEGMAAGLPCVATRVGGIPEVIVEGETGLLAAASNPHELADKLRIVLSDASLRQRFGAAGAARVREKFDAREMHLAYAKIFSEMLNA